jgi:hypothetical protein
MLLRCFGDDITPLDDFMSILPSSLEYLNLWNVVDSLSYSEFLVFPIVRTMPSQELSFYPPYRDSRQRSCRQTEQLDTLL